MTWHYITSHCITLHHITLHYFTYVTYVTYGRCITRVTCHAMPYWIIDFITLRWIALPCVPLPYTALYITYITYSTYIARTTYITYITYITHIPCIAYSTYSTLHTLQKLHTCIHTHVYISYNVRIVMYLQHIGII